MTDDLDEPGRPPARDDLVEAGAAPPVLAPAQPARGRRKLPPGVVAGTAAIAALAIALPNLSWGGSGSDPTRPASGVASLAPADPARTGPLAGSAATSCVENYSPKNLTGRVFAFDGTVVALRSAVNAKNVGDVLYPDATFKVNEWFRGGTGPTVTVSMQTPGDATDVSDAVGAEVDQTYEVGTRLLISGDPLLGGKPLDSPLAWSCGFSRYYDAGTADVWRNTFGDGSGGAPAT